LEYKAMTEETAVQSTSQADGEETQLDVNESQESSAGESGEEAESQEQTSQQQEGKDPNGWALKRIREITRQKHDAERKANEASGEAARYRALVEQMRKESGIEPAQQQALSQDPQDIEALVEQRATQKAQQEQIQARGKSVATVGETEYPDWGAAVQTLDALGISNDQVSAILGMDDAHKVIYSLGKNPEEAARILSLPAVQQGRELERLALKAAQPAAKAVSKAPAPITPVDSNVSAEVDPSKLSMEEWVKWREKNAKTRF
jgi:predicted RNase H-like nuclease (RuvC/YqgF family)